MMHVSAFNTKSTGNIPSQSAPTSSFTLRYWSDTYDLQEMGYPYISLPNPNANLDDSESDCIIRHEKCEKNLIKSKNSNNTILKLFENSVTRAPKRKFCHFKASYFGKSHKEIPADLITYNAYTYLEFADLAKKLSSAMSNSNLYTKSVHNSKRINITAMVTSQSLESNLTFISSYYNNYTNLLIDEHLTGEQIYRVLYDSEVESLFASQWVFIRLVDYLQSRRKKLPELKSVILYEDSNHVEERVELYFEKHTEVKLLFFWDLIYNLESKSNNNYMSSNPAQANTPAIIIYKFFSKESNNNETTYDTCEFLNYKAVVIDHKNIISKIMGYYLFFKKIVSNDSSDIFAICRSISNLDCLCIFLFSMYLSSSIIFIEDISDVMIKEIKENICPHLIYIDPLQFNYLYHKLNQLSWDNLDVKIEQICQRETVMKFEKIANYLFGDKLKIMLVYNQNNIPHHQLVKFKFVSPFIVSVYQGYREETIGSVVVSILNNMVPGSFGLILPCYECKLVKETEETITGDKKENIIIRTKTIKIDNLDSKCSTFTGNLLIKGEGVFDSYFKNYINNSSDSNNYSVLSFNSDNWLVTNLKSVLARNLSIKILDKYEDIEKTVKLNNINIDFIRSLLIPKTLISIVEDIEIIKDEFNYELNILYKADKTKRKEFIRLFLNLDEVSEISQKQENFNFEQFLKEHEHNDNIILYDKYEEYYAHERTVSGSSILHLRNCIIKFIEKVLKNNYILGFEHINKIYLISP